MRLDLRKRVVIFGLGQIAQLAHFYLTQDSEMEVVGFVADDQYLNSESFCGLPVVSSSMACVNFPPTEFSMFVAVSYTRMNLLRRSKCEWARACGYQLVSYVSSRATTFDDLSYGENCLILENNTIQPFVTLGDNVFLWSGNHIGHHSVLEDNVFVSSHCVVSGNCRVGQGSFLGVNCTIQDNVVIGAECFIGPQSLVRHELEPGTVLIGASTPKQKISSRSLRI